MNILIRNQGAVAIIAFSIFALALVELSNATPAGKTKIYKVEGVKLSVSGAAKIKISAVGKVRTGGWTGSQLVQSSTRVENTENSDVVTLHFDFVATKPTGMVTQALMPIAAETTCPAPGAGKTLKVIVHSEANEKSDSIKSPNDPR